MTALLLRLNDRIDGWLAPPTPGAAGRLGVFRVVYAAFYLYIISPFETTAMAHVPEHRWIPAALMRTFTDDIPSAGALGAIEAALVGALVLLLLGLLTRTATVAVLLLGMAYWLVWAPSMRNGYEIVMIAFHVPLFMVISTWGQTLSLDAWLRKRRGLPTVAIDEGGPAYAWPIRSLLIILAVLFATAAYLKVRGGVFLSNPDYVQNVFARYTVRAEQAGLPSTPLRAWLAAQDWLSVPGAWGIVVFEASVWIALLHKRVETIVLAMALLFNAVNALLLGVTFNGMVVIYALFVDWPGVGRALGLDRVRCPRCIDRIPPALAIGGALAIAVGYAFAWDTTTWARLIPTLGGLLDLWTIWYVLTPLAMLWCVAGIVRLLGRTPTA